MGSFHVGGRIVEISGQPVKEVSSARGAAGQGRSQRRVSGRADVRAVFPVGQRERRISAPDVARRRAHGRDIRDHARRARGLAELFLRKGWAVYIGCGGTWPLGLGAISGYLQERAGVPHHDNPFERFRIGEGAGSFDADPAKRKLIRAISFRRRLRGVREAERAALDHDRRRVIAAYIAEIDSVGPSIILFHSQAGSFGFKVAQARPDKVKALIAVEPAGPASRQGDVLKNIPTLIVYGDYIEKDSRWPKIRENGIAFADAIKAAGGSVDVVDLPKAGIKGNSHMVMMDRNNAEVAALIQKWLEGKGLTK